MTRHPLDNATRRRKRLQAHVLAALVLFVPAVAGARTIECIVDPGRHTAYIAPEITITQRGDTQATVSDAIINSTGRKTVSAEVEQSRNNRLRIVWIVPEVRKSPLESRPGPVKLSMRLSIDLPDGAARLQVQDVMNRRYTYAAEGRCTLRD
jgi:hypothetical protein